MPQIRTHSSVLPWYAMFMDHVTRQFLHNAADVNVRLHLFKFSSWEVYFNVAYEAEEEKPRLFPRTCCVLFVIFGIWILARLRNVLENRKYNKLTVLAFRCQKSNA